MKQFAKRSLSLILALVMCLGLLSGIQLPEAEAASYTYNWGTRGTVADEDDFARSTAEEWYAAEGTSYEELSQYTGSATTSSVTSSSMYQQLRSLMRGAVTDTTSYEEIKTLCQYTDCQNGGGSISSFYSGNSIGPSWDGTWNREHTWPDSKGDANGSGENCIFMLRPTSTSENSSRGNTAYGEGSSYYNPNEESGGKYDLRGDVARIVLFVYVRWQDYTSSAAVLYGTSGVIESRAVLLKWMEEDPVDTWELGRNDSCQSITGTRNVFVDYPELAFLMLGDEIPANYTSPSGVGNAVSYTITATSNNTSYGTVSLSGKTITATPKTGYYVSGYTVTSGTATVTQSGNTFKVSAESDCTIRINFAAKTAVTLTFMENGVTGSTVASYGGDSVTLPSYTNTIADGYSFVGWTDATVSDTTTKPTVYTAGTSVTASNKTYYALYSWVDGANSSGNWQLVMDTAALNAGDQYIMAYNAASKVAGGLNGKYLDPLDATFSSDLTEITTLPDGAVIFTLGGSTGSWTFANDAGELLGSSTEKTMTFGTGSTWKITITDGEAVIETSAGTLQYNTSAPRFTTYANASQQSLHLYSMGGTVYYTTSTVVCEHENTASVAAVAATCTETGYTAGVYCNDCDTYISGHEVVAALGHSWGAWVQTTAPTCTATGVETATCARCSETKTQSVAATGHSYNSVVTAPTETQQGYTTYTCLTCGDSYVSDYTEALGETFYVSFSVPADVTAIATMECGKNGITLPTAEAPEGYSFAGWTTAAVEDTETAPEILSGTYNATANVTLYALYTYVEGGTGVSNYVKVTSAPADWSGEYVIVYESGSVILDGSLSSLDANNNNQSVTITENAIAASQADAYKVTIEAVTGGYSIQTASGYYIGATGDSNSLNSNKTTVYTNTLSMNTDGSVNVIGSGGAYLRYNTSANRFRYYKSSTYTGQKAIALYAKTESGTTYYTTLTAEAEPVATVNGVEYTSFADAYAACGEGQYIQLLTACEIELTLEKDLYVDLNGCVLEGIVDTQGYAVYGIDSQTDTYDLSDGSLYLLDAAGESVTPVAFEANGNKYLAVAVSGQWTFNRYYLGTTHVSLDTVNTGLGFKVQLHGNELVMEQVTTLSYKLSLEGGNTLTGSKQITTTGGIFSLRVKNYQIKDYGTAALSCQLSVTLADGTVLESALQSTSMKSAIEAVNEGYASLTEAQLAAVSAFVQTHYETMSAWQVENLYKPQ